MFELINICIGKSSMDPRNKLLKYIFKILEENERFLHEEAKGVLEEVVDLTNDSIDYLRYINQNKYLSQATTFFLAHVLMPQSYALYIDLLTGNLPVCFIELRILVESLAKSYYADLKYPNESFFGDKFLKLENDLKSQNLTITKVVAKVEKEFGFNGELSYLWKDISRSWVHSEGLSKRVIENICEREVPPWGLIIPMTYKETDLQELFELQKDLVIFRNITSSIISSL